MANRYDHRKLAFLNNERWKKRGNNIDVDNLEETLNQERRQSIDTGAGLLGAGRNQATTNDAGSFFRAKSPALPIKPKRGASKRRGTL